MDGLDDGADTAGGTSGSSEDPPGLQLGEGPFPDGTPLWFSRATPGRTHDLIAARAHGIVQACLTREILILGDRAHQGAGATVRTPYKNHREHPEHYQQFNRDHTRLTSQANVLSHS